MRRAEAALGAAGFAPAEMAITRSVDMRYRYQVHELNVPLSPGTAPLTEADLERLYADFDEAYEKAYGKGSGYREAGKEILTFRVTATGLLAQAPHPGGTRGRGVRGPGAEAGAKRFLRGVGGVRSHRRLRFPADAAGNGVVRPGGHRDPRDDGGGESAGPGRDRRFPQHQDIRGRQRRRFLSNRPFDFARLRLATLRANGKRSPVRPELVEGRSQ